MYQNTTIITRKDRANDDTPIDINKGVLQSCSLPKALFSVYTDEVIKD
jgi:hypothetical protein